MPISYESYKEDRPDVFDCSHLLVADDLSNLKEILEEYGVAIVPSIVRGDECDEALGYIHEYFKSLTSTTLNPYNPKDRNTYRSLQNVHRMHSMLFQGYGVGQCQGSWKIRQHPKIVEVFRKIWGKEDLLASMDGVSYQPPPELIPLKKRAGQKKAMKKVKMEVENDEVEGEEEEKEEEEEVGNKDEMKEENHENEIDVTNINTQYGYFRHTWYHTDQNYYRNEFECIQGQVNLFDVDEGDATLMVLEKSHQYHQQFREHFDTGNKNNKKKLFPNEGDWFVLETRGQEKGTSRNGFVSFYTKQKQCIPRRITCPRGSLILWDSRTIHCGSEPLRARPNQHWRCVIYVCMTPRELCDEENMKLRKKAFLEQCTTSHWPHRVKIFPTLAVGRFVTHDPRINLHLEYPILSELGKELLIGKEAANDQNNDFFSSLPNAIDIERPRILSNGRPEKPKKEMKVDIASAETAGNENENVKGGEIKKKRKERENEIIDIDVDEGKEVEDEMTIIEDEMKVEKVETLKKSKRSKKSLF
jgi:hypothetical protein